jgi:hypothetical protein
MSTPKDGPAVNVEVDDPAAAFHRLEDFTRKLLAAPKKTIDRKLVAERARKKREAS